MIVSTVTGRIRIRAPRLKARSSAKAIRRDAAGLPGVLDARVNSGAGCLVVRYDPEVVDTEFLEDRLEALCTASVRRVDGGGRTMSRYLNRATKVGMMTTLATSLAYGYLGKKKPHVGFGTAFLAFAGMHMLRYRAGLIR